VRFLLQKCEARNGGMGVWPGAPPAYAFGLDCRQVLLPGVSCLLLLCVASVMRDNVEVSSVLLLGLIPDACGEVVLAAKLP
jgi:hypothetical protein